MSSKAKWVILGAGNLIFDIIDAIEANNEIVDSIVLNGEINPALKKQLKPLSVPLDEFTFSKDKKYIFGFLDSNKESYIKVLENYSINYSNLFHPTAYVANSAQLGRGNFVGARVVIGAKARVGDYNYFNRGALIGHDVTMGDMNHFGPGANLCGRCVVGSKCNFGASSVVNDGLSICSNCFVGSNSTVIKDTDECGTYIGSPAKLKL